MNLKRVKFYWVTFSIMILFAISMCGKINVYASSITPTPTPESYQFVIGSVPVEDGSEFQVLNSTSQIYIRDSNNQIETDATIVWKSSNEEVVTVNQNATYSHFADLKRVAPGFAMITAMIIKDGKIYNISCNVEVELEIDYSVGKTPHQDTLTTGYEVMALNVDDIQKVYLKYTADSAPINDNTLVNWKSSNEDVAIVEDGYVTAKGSGTTMITITTNTVSTSKLPQTVNLIVVVSPKALNTDTGNYESDFVIAGQSNYIIQSNAGKASNLTWEVYDSDKKIVAANSSKMQYSISQVSGNVTLSNAKAGTYDIYAFVSVNGEYGTGVNIPYLHIKFIVPVALSSNDIVMNVGDTYSIVKNSNIPSSDIFNYSFVPANSTIAQVQSGVITAKAQGEVTLNLTYKSTSNLFTSTPLIPSIKITIIDGLALNLTSSTIYTAGTVQLMAITTDPSTEIIWTSSDENVAKVEDGLVTGVSKGQAVITATQTIQGVVKTATCTIAVQQSVTKITLDPSSVTLDKGKYVTLYAKIEPVGLNNVSLKWITTDSNIVQITNAGTVSATIQGVGAGTAVVTAINQDNVVVGSCMVTVNQKVSSITLSETTATVSLASKQLQLRTVIAPDTATNKDIIWKSTNTSVATVDQYGLVTFVAAGSTSIIATSEDDPTVSAICNITIETPISSLTLDETSKTMYVGDSTKLTYTILPTNASTKSLVWSSTNTSVVSVDSTGLIKAAGAGQAVIILKTSDGLFLKTCTITVKVKTTGVSIDVKSLELDVDQSYTIKTTITPAGSTDVTLTWESTDTNIATVDQNGKVTGKSKGKAIIIVKTSLGGVLYCNVTVLQPVTGVNLNYDEKTIVIKDKYKLKATVVPSSATNLAVTWKSSNTKVATVSSTGYVTGVSGGAAVITCTTKDGGFVATCVVQVVEPVTSIKLNKYSYKLGVGKSYTLKATVKTNAATNPKIQWVSSNSRIASVSSTGKVTGKKAGYVTIYAKALDGSKVEASCEIRVVRAVTSISLNRSSATMVEGRTIKLKATIRPTNATYRTAKWTSSDESIAFVDSYGNVTALKEGKVTITAAAKDSSGKKASCYIIVKAQTPASSVTILNQNLTMVVGETNTLQKAINPSNSTDRYTWESDNKAVAYVDKATGKVTARTPGIANITVMTESGKTATTKITVVGLNTTSLELEQYSKYQLSVIGLSSGTSVTWDIADSEVAVVTNGLVQTRRTGTTTITATVNGRRLTCSLRVVKIR